MAYRWEAPASVWLEDEGRGGFEPAAGEGLGRLDWSGAARGRLADCAHLLGAALPVACAHAVFYPENFAFCPECGKPLGHAVNREAGVRPAGPAQPDAVPGGPFQASSLQASLPQGRLPQDRPALQRHPDWWGPYADTLLPRHVPHGLPVTSLALGDSLEERPAAPEIGRPDAFLAPPPNAHCVFAAASYGFAEQRLIALAPGRGVLQYWDPLAETWHVMQPEDGAAGLAFGASDYGWLPPAALALPARRGDVALVPTARGLYRLAFNPIAETYRTEAVLAAPIVAAPGLMRRHLGCLVRNPGDSLGLCTLGVDLAPGPQYDCGALPLSGWTRPVGYDGQLAWLHGEGQLLWRPGEAPRFIAWPDTWLPSLDLGGPTLSRDGRMWLIGHDGQGYSFLELGADPAQRAPIDGARLGFANLLFRRGHPVVDEPWSGEHVEDQHEDDALVLPLLRSFNNNRSQPSGLVLRFHKYTGRAEEALAGRVLARTTIEWIGRRNAILDDVARLARPLECVPFVYAGRLWLHHPDWNRIRGWNLDVLP